MTPGYKKWRCKKREPGDSGHLTTRTDMIIVPVKEGENIEKCLKKFKRKYEKTGVIKELRRRQQFNEPSQVRRKKMEHAIYVQHLKENAAE